MDFYHVQCAHLSTRSVSCRMYTFVHQKYIMSNLHICPPNMPNVHICPPKVSCLCLKRLDIWTITRRSEEFVFHRSFHLTLHSNLNPFLFYFILFHTAFHFFNHKVSNMKWAWRACIRVRYHILFSTLPPVCVLSMASIIVGFCFTTVPFHL